MTTKSYAGHTVDVDADGFLLDPGQWSREVGEAIAGAADMQLQPAHWKVIEFARQDFLKQGASPGPRRIVAGAGVSMKELYQLFPKGPGKLVAKVAGIPKPKSCL